MDGRSFGSRGSFGSSASVWPVHIVVLMSRESTPGWKDRKEWVDLSPAKCPRLSVPCFFHLKSTEHSRLVKPIGSEARDAAPEL